MGRKATMFIAVMLSAAFVVPFMGDNVLADTEDNWSTTADFDSGTDCDTATITDEYNHTADQLELSFPYADKDANLESYWRFSGDATDETGAFDGTVSGASLTDGVWSGANEAYHFDGVNDEIHFGAAAD